MTPSTALFMNDAATAYAVLALTEAWSLSQNTPVDAPQASAFRREPEQSGRKPIAPGRRKPLRFRLEVIGSMTAAAADRDRNSVGKGHKLSLNAFARTPTTTISASRHQIVRSSVVF